MSDVVTYRWRIGSQVGRTLYIDTDEKHPSNLFGLVDDEAIAAHIVMLHNEWTDRMEAAADLRKRGFTAGAGFDTCGGDK